MKGERGGEGMASVIPNNNRKKDEASRGSSYKAWGSSNPDALSRNQKGIRNPRSRNITKNEAPNLQSMNPPWPEKRRRNRGRMGGTWHQSPAATTEQCGGERGRRWSSDI
jgi:hypothetical protein